MARWYQDFYFTPSRPRAVRGGIKAQSGRSGFGRSWWAKRWIAILEGFHLGNRLSRGRSYARRGQVVSIDVRLGEVKARVQGSRPKPYEVSIGIKPLSAAAWKRLAAIFSRRAIFAAKLLAGEMPENIEEAFREAGLSLFPARLRDVETECSCPDWSNPCKHVAAVYYLLGDEFDRDPFLIFKLRGIEPKALTGLLGSVETAKAGKAAAPLEPAAIPAADIPDTAAALPSDPAAFWGRAPEKSDSAEWGAHIPELCAALPRQLGAFPFWRGEDRFLETLERIYDDASTEGLDIFLDEDHAPSPPPS